MQVKSNTIILHEHEKASIEKHSFSEIELDCMEKLNALHGCEIFKIGMSEDPQRRLKALRTGNPEIQLIHMSRPMEIGEAEELERKLHIKYKRKRVSGEWFKLTATDIQGVQKVLGESKRARQKKATPCGISLLFLAAYGTLLIFAVVLAGDVGFYCLHAAIIVICVGYAIYKSGKAT